MTARASPGRGAQALRPIADCAGAPAADTPRRDPRRICRERRAPTRSGSRRARAPPGGIAECVVGVVRAAERPSRHRNVGEPFPIALADDFVIVRLHERHEVRLCSIRTSARNEKPPKKHASAMCITLRRTRRPHALRLIELSTSRERFTAKGLGCRTHRARRCRSRCRARRVLVAPRLELRARDSDKRTRRVTPARHTRERLLGHRVVAMGERSLGLGERRRNRRIARISGARITTRITTCASARNARITSAWSGLRLRDDANGGASAQIKTKRKDRDFSLRNHTSRCVRNASRPPDCFDAVQRRPPVPTHALSPKRACRAASSGGCAPGAR